MTVTYANHWDAAKLLNELTPEQLRSLKQSIADRKLLHAVFERPYNEELCSFVEKRLAAEVA